MDLLGLNQVSSRSFPASQVPILPATLSLQKRMKAGELLPSRVRSERAADRGRSRVKTGGFMAESLATGGEEYELQGECSVCWGRRWVGGPGEEQGREVNWKGWDKCWKHGEGWLWKQADINSELGWTGRLEQVREEWYSTFTGVYCGVHIVHVCALVCVVYHGFIFQVRSLGLSEVWLPAQGHTGCGHCTLLLSSGLLAPKSMALPLRTCSCLF